MTLKAWVKAVAKNGLGDGFLDLTGPSPATVAETLGCHRSRVYQLIDDDSIDAIHVTAPNGTITMTLITENSLNRYLKNREPSRRNPDGYTVLPAEKVS